MDADQLQQAAAQAKTGWLEKELITRLPQVWDLSLNTPNWKQTASEWAAQIDHLFEQKKLFTPGQQKNRRTDIANALRTIDPQHPAISFILLPSSVYTSLNNEQANRLNARQNKLFSAQQANELVQRATHLLSSNKPDEVAAGLAVLIGRRISEILISHFKPKTAYSLLFSEAVKRRGEIGLEFEIPTLAEATLVLTAIQQLQNTWNIADLKALDLSTNQLKRKINARYSGVPKTCRQHFADLIPGREAETDTGDRLYTHLFRAVYAEIATYYYKPSWVPDYRFKAEVQGHFKFSEEGQKISNYSARQNYDDYLIRDRRPGESGIKLGLPGVQILEIFQKEESIVAKQNTTAQSHHLEPATIKAILYRAVDRLLFSKQWQDVITGLILVSGRSVETLLNASPTPKTQFSMVINGLEVPTLTGASQVISAWNKFQQQLPLTESEIPAAVQSVCLLTFQDLAPIQTIDDLRAVYSAISLHWFCPPEVESQVFLSVIQAAAIGNFITANPDRGIKLGQRQIAILEQLQPLQQETPPAIPKIETEVHEETIPMQHQPKSRHRRKVVSVDADLLRSVAATFGLEIRGQGGTRGLSYEAALTQLLTQLAAGQQPPSVPAVEPEWTIAVKDQARTMAWLTGRVEILERQIDTLKQEHTTELAQARQNQFSAELEQLRQENEQLRQERDQATRKLEVFKQLLTGNSEETVTPISPNPSSSIDPLPPEPTPAPDPVSNTPEVAKSSRKRLAEEDALQHIRQAIEAIMDFNNKSTTAFDEKWYISFPVVQTLLRINGLPASQTNVGAVFEAMQADLEAHHDRHRLGSRHNRRHPDVSRIAQVIKLEPLT